MPQEVLIHLLNICIKRQLWDTQASWIITDFCFEKKFSILVIPKIEI